MYIEPWICHLKDACKRHCHSFFFCKLLKLYQVVLRIWARFVTQNVDSRCFCSHTFNYSAIFSMGKLIEHMFVLQTKFCLPNRWKCCRRPTANLLFQKRRHMNSTNIQRKSSSRLIYLVLINFQCVQTTKTSTKSRNWCSQIVVRVLEN